MFGLGKSLLMTVTLLGVSPLLAAPTPAATPSHPAVSKKSKPAASSTTVVEKKEEPPRFSGFLLAARSHSLYDFKDGKKSEGMEYTLRLVARLWAQYSLKVTGVYSDDLRDQERGGQWQDTVAMLGHKPSPLGSYLLFSPLVGLGLPTSKASQDAGLQASPKLGFVTLINPDKLVPGLTLALNIVASRNIHSYETARSGAVNTAYGLTQNLNAAYEWKSLSFTLDFVHVNNWSYQNAMRDVFQMTQEIGYNVNKSLALALGHTNGGSTLKADGMTSNVEFIDENSSLVYVAGQVNF